MLSLIDGYVLTQIRKAKEQTKQSGQIELKNYNTLANSNSNLNFSDASQPVQSNFPEKTVIPKKRFYSPFRLISLGGRN